MTACPRCGAKSWYLDEDGVLRCMLCCRPAQPPPVVAEDLPAAEPSPVVRRRPDIVASLEAVYTVISTAETPVPARTVALQTGLSRSAARHRLRELRSAGRIRSDEGWLYRV